MEELSGTTRQQREQSHYDEYYKGDMERFPPAQSAFRIISGKESRSHNIFWDFMRIVQEAQVQNKLVLDMGCGTGYHTVLYCKLGAKVFAYDISPVAVSVARARLAHYGLDQDAALAVMGAEHLSYPDAMFDFVFGVDVIHHVDVDPAAKEIARVLKPGGMGLFLEWIEWAFFERIRNQPFVLKLFPHGGWHDARADITADEKKLGQREQEILRSHFSSVTYKKFYFLNRLGPFFPRFGGFLEKVDQALFRAFAHIENAAAAAIIIAKKG